MAAKQRQRIKQSYKPNSFIQAFYEELKNTGHDALAAKLIDKEYERKLLEHKIMRANGRYLDLVQKPVPPKAPGTIEEFNWKGLPIDERTGKTMRRPRTVSLYTNEGGNLADTYGTSNVSLGLVDRTGHRPAMFSVVSPDGIVKRTRGGQPKLPAGTYIKYQSNGMPVLNKEGLTALYRLNDLGFGTLDNEATRQYAAELKLAEEIIEAANKSYVDDLTSYALALSRGEKAENLTNPDVKRYVAQLDRYYKQLSRAEKYTEKHNERTRVKEAKRSKKLEDRLAKKEARRKEKGQISPAIYAGISPFNPEYGSMKHWTKEQYEAMGVDYDKLISPKMKRMDLADGTHTMVIDNYMFVPLGFDKPIGYKQAANVMYSDGSTMLDKYEQSFNGGGSGEDDGFFEWQGSGDCGHIVRIRYSLAAQMMEVTFRNGGAVVIYDHIPSKVALELIHLGESGSMALGQDNKPRHTVGIRFWDLVRIRGTLHGSQYPYHYASQGEYYRKTQDVNKMPNGYFNKRNKLKKSIDERFKERSTNLAEALKYGDISQDTYNELMEELNSSKEQLQQEAVKYLDKNYEARVGKQVKPLVDRVDDYFDMFYAKDLTNKGLNDKMLHKAYEAYNKGVDFADIADMLKQAGVTSIFTKGEIEK